MKRYFVFAGGEYYPREGMTNFLSDFDTLEELYEKVPLILKGELPISSLHYLGNCEHFMLSLDWLQVFDQEQRRMMQVDLGADVQEWITPEMLKIFDRLNGPESGFKATGSYEPTQYFGLYRPEKEPE